MESADQMMDARTKGYVRGLPVPKESFLLLEFLELLLVGALLNEPVDVEEIPFGRDVEASILLPDATVPLRGEGARRRAGSHALGARAGIHLLLVEGHPLGVVVG